MYPKVKNRCENSPSITAYEVKGKVSMKQRNQFKMNTGEATIDLSDSRKAGIGFPLWHKGLSIRAFEGI